VRQVRVWLQVVGMLGPALCLLLAVSPVVGGSPVMASSLITVGLGLSALTLGGVSVSHLDIAPRHAGGPSVDLLLVICVLCYLAQIDAHESFVHSGVIFGAGNTAATLAGFLSVPLTGYLLETTKSWPLVFGITALHYVVGAVVWSLWVGDKVLPEDMLEDDPKEERV
jgi:ACS family sodium-dependent inorganic phosphate cotransporter